MQSEQTVGEISTHQPHFRSTINKLSHSLQLLKWFLLCDVNLYPHKQPILEMSRKLEIGKGHQEQENPIFFSVLREYV